MLKFLDSQRIVNLTDYLQELHRVKLANEDHTTLLLNCYTKLKDEQRLNSFLMEKNVEFDIDTGIKVLRQSGYYKQALELCDKHHKHEDYLKIQLENLKEYDKALDYIQRLDHPSAILNLKKYGKLLMSVIADKTVEFLKKLCSTYDTQQDRFIVEPAEFLHIFLGNSTQYLIDFLEHIHVKQLSNSKLIVNTLLELYVKRISEQKGKDSGDDAKLTSINEKKALDFLATNISSYDMNLALSICQLHQFKVRI